MSESRLRIPGGVICFGALGAAVAEVVGGGFVFGAAHTRPAYGEQEAKKRRVCIKKTIGCLHYRASLRVFELIALGEWYRAGWRSCTAERRHHPLGLVHLLPERDRSGQYRDQRDEDTKDLLQLRQQPSAATMGCLHG